MGRDGDSPGDTGELSFSSACDDAGVGEGVAVAVDILFFRGFGVAVGRTKSFFSLSPSVSLCCCGSCAWAMFIAMLIAIAKPARRLNFTPL
jgi:hypothetical protein